MPQPQTSSRLTAEERREAIIQTAMELFSQDGFRGTTTRELAAACGVSEPTIYQHFATKRDLYTAIIDTVSLREADTLGEELAELSEAGDDVAYFTRVGEILINFHEQNPAFIRLLFFSALEKHELAELFFTRMSCKFLELIAGYIRRRIDASHFRNVNPTVAAKHFCGGLSDYSMWRITCQFKTEDLPPKEVYLSEVVSIFLNGVRA
ncbi:MAG: TetR/AcrR family transcriptional regulator [Bryobacteraceae bacterium]